jgi:hypothetical protein
MPRPARSSLAERKTAQVSRRAPSGPSRIPTPGVEPLHPYGCSIQPTAVVSSASVGQLIALTDALRNSSLNPAQTEIVRSLREGLGMLEERSMEDVKVLETV